MEHNVRESLQTRQHKHLQLIQYDKNKPKWVLSDKERARQCTGLIALPQESNAALSRDRGLTYSITREYVKMTAFSKHSINATSQNLNAPSLVSGSWSAVCRPPDIGSESPTGGGGSPVRRTWAPPPAGQSGWQRRGPGQRPAAPPPPPPPPAAAAAGTAETTIRAQSDRQVRQTDIHIDKQICQTDRQTDRSDF